MNQGVIKIILVAADAKGKNLVFVDNELRVYSLEEAIRSAKEGLFKNIYVVNRSGNFYLRTGQNTLKENRLDQISISSHQLFSYLDNINRILSIPAFENYWRIYQETLNEKKNVYIIIDGHPRVAKEIVKSKLQFHQNLIFEAAKKFNIDSYLLAAIIIDEIARAHPIEEIVDLLAVYFVGKNTSVGIAQVKIDTARGLIKDGYYNPDPNKLSSDNIYKISRRQLYQYVKQPRHNIFFAAARIRALIDEWKKFVDLNRKPEILATLYSMGHITPHDNPQSNEHGNKIANEFYQLSKEWFH